ncbi:probable atp18-subunit i j of the mitochondrial f1f0-atp synthase [Ceraceosorus bombacis]|uniref:ATP synthase subunit J, mitochondrial n=2 Tax=Ceraceosorus TaxID=401624 RepID=A0A316VSY1_9BASI|nr:ATP synthase subunit J, mitochondrial [Ceraceosorus guamensis]PWN40697.1 ATP synthase subunit J, mitochondrial [Ceraceosorus guamensis]CEH13898.1 probable atp18-subunit i j of the mitochondrial f1f0-atp synthase [Ceraceosorus bombacis]
MFGYRAYPTPIIRPLWPFLTAGVIVYAGINYLQDAAVSTPEAKKDPKNPYALKGGNGH